MRERILYAICLLFNIGKSLAALSGDVCLSYVVGVNEYVFPQVECSYNQVCSGTCYSRYCTSINPQIDIKLDQTSCPNNYWYSPTSTTSDPFDYDFEE